MQNDDRGAGRAFEPLGLDENGGAFLPRDIKRDFIWYSSKDHDGRDELWKRIAGLTGLSDATIS